MSAPKWLVQERDAADMARVQTGDDGALANLMGRHGPALMRFLWRRLLDRAEAAEVMHEAFVRVYKNRYRFDFHRAFSTWLYTIATNLACDHLRCRARQPDVVPLDFNEAADGEAAPAAPVDPAGAPDARLQTKECFIELNAWLNELPEKLRTPLLLVAFDGLSQAEVAALLRCSPKTVEMRLYHARQWLRNKTPGLRSLS